MVRLLLAVVQVGVEDRLLVESHPVTEECEVVGVVEVVDVVVVGEALELPTVPLSPELCSPDQSSYYKRHFYSWITLNFGYKVLCDLAAAPDVGERMVSVVRTDLSVDDVVPAHRVQQSTSEIHKFRL